MRKTPIGMVGLGAMGLSMARVLLGKGFAVRGCDLDEQAVSHLVEAGGQAAASPAEAVAGSDVFLVMVVNDEQVGEVLFGDKGAAGAMAKGGVVLVCSTVSPAFARQIAARLIGQGLQMLDAPVSGGVSGAARGTLTVMAAGSSAAFDRCKPVLDAIGENIFHLGEECGQGATMKMINQLLCGVHLAAAAEAMALGARAGIDGRKIHEIISTSAGCSWMYRDRVPRMLERAYEPPKSAVDIFVKDLGLVLAAGDNLHFPLPLAAAARQLFMMATAAGYGRLDDAAVVKVYERLAGMAVGQPPGET